MNKMTKAEMVEFLKGMELRSKILKEEKRQLLGSVETMDEAIKRNSFSHADNGSGSTSAGFAPDKVLRVLLSSQRDIEEETRAMVLHMRDIYEKEDQIRFVRHCLLQMESSDQHLIREAYLKDVLIDQLGYRLCLSRSQVYRRLQRAVDHLVEIYNASCQEISSFRAQRLIREVIPYMPEGSIA